MSIASKPLILILEWADDRCDIVRCDAATYQVIWWNSQRIPNVRVWQPIGMRWDTPLAKPIELKRDAL